MNWLDIVLLVAIALATVAGLGIGIIRAGLSLAGLIFGIVLAGHYYIPFSQVLDAVLQPTVAKVVAFIIILAAVMVAAVFLAIFLRRGASAIKLGWADRLGGAVFGLVMGAILCGCLLAIWVKFVGSAEAITQSTLARLLLDRMPMVLALLPDEFDVVRSFFQ
jgi:membrane protein required for colicin V production